MILGIGQLVLGAAFIAASTLLATTEPTQTPALRALAAVLVAAPAAWSFVGGVRRLRGSLNRQARTQVKRALQSTLIKLNEDGAFQKSNGTHRANIMHVSLHVWLVPLWYRIIFPYSLRRRLKRVRKLDGLRWRLRAPLVRFVKFRFEHRPASDVRFRVGKGVIGRCVDIKGDRALIASFHGPAATRALSSEEAWNQARVEITQKLEYEEAQELSRRYSQVIAFAIFRSSGEAIGCLTFSFPREGTNGLVRSYSDPLLREIRSLSYQVQNLLT